MRLGCWKWRSVRAVSKVPQSSNPAVSGSTDEPLSPAPRPDCQRARLALRLLQCRQLRMGPLVLSAYRRLCQGRDQAVAEIQVSTVTTMQEWGSLHSLLLN